MDYDAKMNTLARDMEGALTALNATLKEAHSNSFQASVVAYGEFDTAKIGVRRSYTPESEDVLWCGLPTPQD